MPFKSERQRRYMHANMPEIADEWENHGGIYPAPENFNPGGEDAEIQGNMRPAYGDTFGVDGGSPIRDRDYDPRVDGPID